MRSRITLVEKQDGHVDIFVHVNLVGEDVVKSIEDQIFGQINVTGSQIVLHLQEVGYMSSAGLALLIKLLTKSTISGGSLVLKGVTEPVLNLLTLTKLTNVFVLQ